MTESDLIEFKIHVANIYKAFHKMIDEKEAMLMPQILRGIKTETMQTEKVN